MLVAYDVDGNIIATQDYRTVYDDDDNPLGMVDYAAHEEAGGEMTDLWTVVQREGQGPSMVETPAKGSKVWPEWIGGAAHHFRVELEGPPGRKRIAALVHKVSGHRRERAVLEAEIAERIREKRAAARFFGTPEPADIRDLVGGPDRPLHLDADGRTKSRPKPETLNVPIVKREPQGVPHQ